MLKIIEAFKKDAEKIGEDTNSMEQLTMWVEADGHRDNVDESDEAVEEAVGTIIADLSDSLHAAAEHIATQYGAHDSHDVYHRLVDMVREAEWD